MNNLAGCVTKGYGRVVRVPLEKTHYIRGKAKMTVRVGLAVADGACSWSHKGWAA